MAKTVKELFEKIKDIYKCQMREDWIIFELEEAVKNEIAEKDRKIDLLLRANKQITYSNKNREYNQPKLYKEDFDFSCTKCKNILSDLEIKNTCYFCGAETDEEYFIKLKDNSKYELLESKEELK